MNAGLLGFGGPASSRAGLARDRQGVWVATSATSSTPASDPGAQQDVNAMTVTFTLPQECLCLLTYGGSSTRAAGGNRFAFHDNGVQLSPFAAANHDYSIGEASGRQMLMSQWFVLAAGPHTVKVTEDAAGTTNVPTFLQRMLLVEAFAEVPLP